MTTDTPLTLFVRPDSEWSESEIEGLKAWLKNNGGAYVSPLLAQHAEAKGFVEGVHFHINRPLPRTIKDDRHGR